MRDFLKGHCEHSESNSSLLNMTFRLCQLRNKIYSSLLIYLMLIFRLNLLLYSCLCRRDYELMKANSNDDEGRGVLISVILLHALSGTVSTLTL